MRLNKSAVLGLLEPRRLFGIISRRRAIVQQTLVYRSERKKPLLEAALFQSFEGATVGDSPLQIALELAKRNTGLELFYVVKKSNQQVPAGLSTVIFGSRKWLSLLARAQYLTANNNLPEFFSKRDGQTYVQTWHGTPLKRLGRDIETNAASPFYIAAMAREAAGWNYLISPSNYCTQILPKALGYQGEVLEVGYPRNDHLTDLHAAAIRAKLRDQLGVKVTETLVLYAPTWRDTKRTATGAWAGVNFFGSAANLPQGFRLAFRGHNNTAKNNSGKTANGAIDVTSYPDITELYLAADILVTDYSSSMFDFSVTGKPMMFLVPDLEEYEANRGFYFDFRSEAPGKLYDNAEALIADLPKAKQINVQYAVKYAQWRQMFNPLEDGHAAARTVDKVWGTKS